MKKYIRNFLLMTTMTTTAVYIFNRMINTTSDKKNILKTDRGKFYNWRYGNIYYTKQGKGKPVLLIHDLNPAASSFEWNRIVKHLAKKHTVYTIDLLGCGRSDKPNMTYSNFLYVQLVTDFIKNIVGEKADVVSTGESSSFSLMACNMNPECFNKIIIINPSDLATLNKTPNKRKNALKFFIDTPMLGTLIYNLIYTNRNINHTFYNRYYYKRHMVPTKLVHAYHEAAHICHSNGKYLLSSMKANYTNINIVHALKKINNSIYLIESKEKTNCKEIINSYLSYNSSIEASYINNSIYLPQLEVPEQLLDILNLYLDPIK